MYIEENKSANKKVEKGKLSERVGRKVMGLKHGHCELLPLSLRGAKRRSNLIYAMTARLPTLIFFLVIPAQAGIQRKKERG